MSKFLAACMILVASAQVLNAAGGRSSYICITDMQAGFEKQGDSWRSRLFEANEKYLVKWQDEIGFYSFIRFGFQTPSALCRVEPGTNKCVGYNVYGFVDFDMSGLRFTITYRPGYIENIDGNTTTISAGVCSQL